MESSIAPGDREEGDPGGQGPAKAAGTGLVACFLPSWSKVHRRFPRKTGWTLDLRILLPQAVFSDHDTLAHWGGGALYSFSINQDRELSVAAFFKAARREAQVLSPLLPLVC